MAIDFDALDLVRTKNKAKRHEAIKVQKREQKEKDIKYFMDQLSTIKEIMTCAMIQQLKIAVR
ncbi:hypothetical protein [uncultured phage MedDCM-OCT-S04-C1227]|nr:hypothetical protein [uncultured phage MedDCM-OCT-S04-C1227]